MPIKVSIVEDDSEARDLLASLVNRAPGFQCISRHGDAEAALAALPGLKPDVVLMDINLPGQSGVECVRQLKPRVVSTVCTHIRSHLREAARPLARPGRGAVSQTCARIGLKHLI